MIKLTQPINILVQRRASIGDVIMTTGIVRELKKRYGANANIDVATDYAGIYKNNPHIRNVFPVDQIPSVSNWDIYYNLDDAYELNPYTNYVDAYFYRVFGTTNLDKSVELFGSPDEKTKIDGDYIVVHLRNWHWQAKNISMDVWFDVFAKVFEVSPTVKVVCVGGSTDHYVDHPNFVDLRDKLDSQQIKNLCDNAKCFVGIDSGPYWCAAASKTHAIGLLTHLMPDRIMFERKRDYMYNATAIQTLEDCAGCNDRQQRPIRQIICEKTNFPCTNNFSTDAIASAILRTL